MDTWISTMDMDWHTGQSQAGQKGRQLEVGAWLTSLLVSDSICEWGDNNAVKLGNLTKTHVRGAIKS